MSIFTGFRMPDDLSDKLNAYCSNNKLSKTEAMNIAVEKLISKPVPGISNNAVIDEIYILVRNHLLLDINFSMKNSREEIDKSLEELNNISYKELNKIKKQAK